MADKDFSGILDSVQETTKKDSSPMLNLVIEGRKMSYFGRSRGTKAEKEEDVAKAAKALEQKKGKIIGGNYWMNTKGQNTYYNISGFDEATLKIEAEDKKTPAIPRPDSAKLSEADLAKRRQAFRAKRVTAQKEGLEDALAALEGVIGPFEWMDIDSVTKASLMDWATSFRLSEERGYK